MTKYVLYVSRLTYSQYIISHFIMNRFIPGVAASTWGREQPGEALASSKAEQMVGTDMYENGLRNNKLCHSKTSDNYKLPWL